MTSLVLHAEDRMYERYEECEVCQEKYWDKDIHGWMFETNTGFVCTGCYCREKGYEQEKRKAGRTVSRRS